MAIWKDIVAKDSTQTEGSAASPPPVNRPRPEAVPSTVPSSSSISSGRSLRTRATRSRTSFAANPWRRKMRAATSMVL